MKNFLPLFFVWLTMVAGWPSLSESQNANDAEAREQFEQAMSATVSAYAAIHTYTLEIYLQERYKDEIKGVEHIKSVFRKNPFKLCNTWLDDGLYGDMQTCYVADRDGPNHFMIRSVGAARVLGAGRMDFDDYGVRVLCPHHFNPNQYHLGFLLDYMQQLQHKAIGINKFQVFAEGLSTSLLPGRTVKLYRLELSTDPNDGLPFRSARLGFDQRTRLPLFIETTTFRGQLHSSYKITIFTPNAAIDDTIFDLQ